MAKQYAHIPERWARFITEQKIFFVATATCDSRVNVSPKGLDSLRILDPNRVAWLNLTGSGNESAAHVQSDPRMTLMFCAFGGEPPRPQSRCVVEPHGERQRVRGPCPE
ncbi:hypothetical protein C4901_06070 [Acidiferrobacter sp. SPIII_3]|nr:pyridoxamine 5'-phosphate oxidase family protein [Acidiferrobacter sp. SPIII_3]AWP22953.1 hypothetical protein C4901_06070 [Acidiferrobacter sp. SPIII_3]